MAFSPENLKIRVNSRGIQAFIQTATYRLFTKGVLHCTPLWRQQLVAMSFSVPNACSKPSS